MDISTFSSQLTASDYIEIWGIIVSLLCSIIAIVISLKTLKPLFP